MARLGAPEEAALARKLTACAALFAGALLASALAPRPSAVAAPGNLVFLPLSLSTALAMATERATRGTRSQLRSALYLRLPRKRMGRAFRTVLARLAPRYDDGVERLVADPSSAAAAINAWAAEQTRGLVPSVVGPNDIPGQRGLVLVAAAYFPGPWAQPFSTTSDGAFWRADGVVVAPLMHRTGNCAWQFRVVRRARTPRRRDPEQRR